MATKKLRGKGTIEVDNAIIRWRQRLRKEGIALGKNMKQAEEKRAYNKLTRSMDTVDKLKRKKWFE